MVVSVVVVENRSAAILDMAAEMHLHSAGSVQFFCMTDRVVVDIVVVVVAAVDVVVVVDHEQPSSLTTKIITNNPFCLEYIIK